MPASTGGGAPPKGDASLQHLGDTPPAATSCLTDSTTGASDRLSPPSSPSLPQGPIYASFPSPPPLSPPSPVDATSGALTALAPPMTRSGWGNTRPRPGPPPGSGLPPAAAPSSFPPPSPTVPLPTCQSLAEGGTTTLAGTSPPARPKNAPVRLQWLPLPPPTPPLSPHSWAPLLPTHRRSPPPASHRVAPPSPPAPPTHDRHPPTAPSSAPPPPPCFPPHTNSRPEAGRGRGQRQTLGTGVRLGGGGMEGAARSKRLNIIREHR